jgi:F0F1-type ATP synthase delta subunit
MVCNRWTLIDTGEYLWDLVTSPIETAKKTYAQFENMVDAIANMGETLRNFGNFFSSLDGEAKAHLICSFLGALGTDVLLAVLTFGGSTPKLVHSLTMYLSRFSKLTKTLRLANLSKKFNRFFPKEFLSKLAKGKVADKVLDRIETFSKNDMPRLSQAAVRCAI